MSFFFNWIGLLMTFCLSRTIAGRTGGVSGFGLSLVKVAAVLYRLHRMEMDGLIAKEDADRLPPYHAWALIAALSF